MKRRKALIIGLDGMSGAVCEDVAPPSIMSFAAKSAYTFSAESEAVTVSGTAWTSLLTGVHMDKHRVVGNEFRWRDRRFRTLFALAKEEIPGIRTAAHAHWEPIITEIFELDSLDMKTTGSDKEVTDRIVESITKDSGDLFFVHLDDIDGAGHKYDYTKGSRLYRTAIERADRFVGEMLAAVDAKRDTEEWFVAIVSDHGGRERSHGNASPEEIGIAILLSPTPALRPGPLHGTNERAFRIVEVAPIVSSFLGLRDQSYWDGRR